MSGGPSAGWITGRIRAAFDPAHNGAFDAFLLVLGPAGGGLLYSTFLGTPLADYGRGIGTDADGYAYLAGYTGFENVDAFGLKLDTMANPRP